MDFGTYRFFVALYVRSDTMLLFSMEFAVGDDDDGLLLMLLVCMGWLLLRFFGDVSANAVGTFLLGLL